MKVYNKDKTEQLYSYDLTKGSLIADKILISILPKIEYKPGKSVLEKVKDYQTQNIEIINIRGQYYKVDKSFSSGGKSVTLITPDLEVLEQPEKEVYEDIYVFIPFTDNELLERQKEELRKQRETDCYYYINRNYIISGKSVSWYDTLTTEQQKIVDAWVQAWRDVTTTLTVPQKPEFII